MRGNKSWMHFILPVIALILGITLAGFGIRSLVLAKQSETWPVVTGTIQFSRVDDQTDEDGFTTYQPYIRYLYVVDAKEYRTEGVSFGYSSFSQKSEAKAIQRKYPEGGSVNVFFDPDDPRTAVLEPGTQGGGFLLIAAGTFFALFGGGFLWVAVTQ